MLSIEELLKQDLIRFLDERTEQRLDRKKIVRQEEANLFVLTKDYSKEVREALAKDQVGHAKELFDELRKKYNAMAYHHIDKAKFYRILEDAYKQIRNYLTEKKKERDLYQEMDATNLSPHQEQPSSLNPLSVLATLQQTIATAQQNSTPDTLKLTAAQIITLYNKLPEEQRTLEIKTAIKQLLEKLSAPKVEPREQ